MKRFTALFMVLVLLVCGTMTVSAEETSNVSSSGFENDPFAIASRALSYDAYFQNEYGFFLDDWSNETSYLALQKSDGSSLFTQQGNTMKYNGSNVSGCVGNREIVFFCVNQTIYRYHVQSKRIDTILFEPSMVTFYPITSDMILWGTSTDLNVGFTSAIATTQISEENMVYTMSNHYRNTSYIVTEPERFISYTECGPYMNFHNIQADADTNAVINGKIIPHPNYRAGDYWDECDPSLGATQCAGFALYIYRYIWGTTGTMVSANIPITYNEVKRLGNGSRLRFRNSAGNEHSAIMYSKTSTSMGIYDANWAGDNSIRFSLYPYSTLQNQLGTIIYFASGSSDPSI